jgi:S1-C subfamily serine protease
MIDYSKIIEKIKPSIAFIKVIGGGSDIRTGSGFVFQKPGTLVTCNHVVLEPFNKILLQFPDTDNKPTVNLVEAKVVDRSLKHDIAILEFQDTENRQPLPVSKIDIKEGMPVIFSGFPLRLDTLTTHQGIISSITKNQAGEKTYLIDGTINQGNSGCPLMDINGELIGVVKATHGEEKELLESVEKVESGGLLLQGIDLIEVYKALIKNLQLGIGYAVPCAYIRKEHE